MEIQGISAVITSKNNNIKNKKFQLNQHVNSPELKNDTVSFSGIKPKSSLTKNTLARAAAIMLGLSTAFTMGNTAGKNANIAHAEEINIETQNTAKNQTNCPDVENINTTEAETVPSLKAENQSNCPDVEIIDTTDAEAVPSLITETDSAKETEKSAEELDKEYHENNKFDIDETETDSTEETEKSAEELDKEYHESHHEFDILQYMEDDAYFHVDYPSLLTDREKEIIEQHNKEVSENHDYNLYLRKQDDLEMEKAELDNINSIITTYDEEIEANKKFIRQEINPSLKEENLNIKKDNKKLNNINEKISTLKEKKEDIKNKIDNYRTQKENIKEKLNNPELSKSKQIKLKEQKDLKQEQIKNTKLKKENIQEKLNSQREKRQEVKSDIKETQKVIDMLQSTKEEVQKETQQYKADKVELESQREEKSKTIAELTDFVENFTEAPTICVDNSICD